MMMRRRGGLVRAAATTAVVAGTAGAVRHRQEQRYQTQAQSEAYEQQQAQQAAYDQQQAAAQYAQPAPAPAPAAPAPAPAAPEDPTVAQIQKLAELHAQGILSDEEFAAAKAKALGI